MFNPRCCSAETSSGGHGAERKSVVQTTIHGMANDANFGNRIKM